MQDVERLRCERSKNVAIYLRDRFSETLKDYQESLFLKNELSFGFLDISVEDIVGKMFDKKQVNKSWRFYFRVRFTGHIRGNSCTN